DDVTRRIVVANRDDRLAAYRDVGASDGNIVRDDAPVHGRSRDHPQGYIHSAAWLDGNEAGEREQSMCGSAHAVSAAARAGEPKPSIAIRDRDLPHRAIGRSTRVISIWLDPDRGVGKGCARDRGFG